LRKIDELWRTRRADLEQSGRRVVEDLRGAEAAASVATLDAGVLRKGWAGFAAQFDREHSGFGGAPKVPRPSSLNFLLRWYAREGGPAGLRPAGGEAKRSPLNVDDTPARMVLATQHMMARGGMYDHLGGGFHRYSVDRFWHVPHFEKMLYDQAQLVASYVEGWQVGGDAPLRQAVRETCDYVLRDLARPEGGFASAEDADSGPERKEGA